MLVTRLSHVVGGLLLGAMMAVSLNCLLQLHVAARARLALICDVLRHSTQTWLWWHIGQFSQTSAIC